MAQRGIGAMGLCNKKSLIHISSLFMVLFLTSSPFVSAEDIQKRAAVLNNSAVERIKHNKYHEAIELLNEAISLKADNGFFYFNRGYAYEGLKEYNKAIINYTVAIRLVPDHWPSYFQRGSLYFLTKKCDDAVKDLNKTLELNPKVVNAYNLRGLCYRHSGLYAKACSDFKKACELGDCAVLNSPGIKEKCN
jgi:tetratricopeptide (TPR) repeat protein